MAIKQGSTVRLIQPVIQGEVVQMMTDNSSFGYLVRYTTPDGEGHERFFPADQLEEVTE